MRPYRELLLVCWLKTVVVKWFPIPGGNRGSIIGCKKLYPDTAGDSAPHRFRGPLVAAVNRRQG